MIGAVRRRPTTTSTIFKEESEPRGDTFDFRTAVAQKQEVGMVPSTEEIELALRTYGTHQPKWAEFSDQFQVNDPVWIELRGNVCATQTLAVEATAVLDATAGTLELGRCVL